MKASSAKYVDELLAHRTQYQALELILMGWLAPTASEISVIYSVCMEIRWQVIILKLNSEQNKQKKKKKIED